MGKVWTCYACDAPYTGREHAPPSCLFPEGHRVNLITVKSCDLHNGDKSKEDQVFAYSIASACNGNELAFPVIDATKRAWEERAHLRQVFMPNEKECWTPELGNTGSYQADLPKFEGSVRSMTKAIYFKHFKEKLLTDDLGIMWGVLRFPSDLEAPFAAVTMKLDRQFGPMKHGSNPRVFQYDFHDLQHKGQTLHFARFKFFEGEPLFVYWPASLISADV